MHLPQIIPIVISYKISILTVCITVAEIVTDKNGRGGGSLSKGGLCIGAILALLLSASVSVSVNDHLQC